MFGAAFGYMFPNCDNRSREKLANCDVLQIEHDLTQPARDLIRCDGDRDRLRRARKPP